MRAIENLSGRKRLMPLYEHWRSHVAGKSKSQWSDLLELIGTDLEVAAPPRWHESVGDEPLVMIGNHPFGIADGIAILALAERMGRPYRILLNVDFMRVPEVQQVGLPIDFSDTRQALETNLKTRSEARRLLKEGVTIVIFPAGGVATAETPFGKAEELPWKLFPARLIQQSGAAVLPVYFEGQNSPLFHFASRYSLSVRLALLVSEFRHRVGTRMTVHVGKPVRIGGPGEARDPAAVLEELYLMVHRLAPGATGVAREALLPRPAEKRRRYPWEPAANSRPAPKGASRREATPT